MLMNLFQEQVARQCRFLLMAADEAQAALNELQVRRTDRNAMNRFWFSAEHMMSAAANISKALWGSGRKQAEIAARREPLRASLEVADNSPLRVKDLRNHLEHFDERLDQWLDESKRQWHVDGGMGTLEGFIEPPPEPVEVFRFYNPTTGYLTFWGDSISIPAIVKEAETLLPKAEAEADKPYAAPPSPPKTSGGGQ
jgi:hypothetical protein